MKKTFLLFVFAVTASVTMAQNNSMYSLLYHGEPGYFHSVRNIMQQRDGDIVLNVHISEDTGNLGSMLYKVDPTTFAITDSLFIDNPLDNLEDNFFLAQNPNGEGNIRANFEYHEGCDSTFVRISHFPDNDLHANPEEDILVPVCEGLAYGGGSSSMVDCRGDLIMLYCKERPDLGIERYDYFVARIGPDGTLKHLAMLSEDYYRYEAKIRAFKESPLQYYQKGYMESCYPQNLTVFMIDSLFHQNPLPLSHILSEEVIDEYHTAYEYYSANGYDDVIPIGGDKILLAARYESNINFHSTPENGEYGVVVAKYDLRTMQLKGYVVFNDYPGYYKRAEYMGLRMMSDGTVYFAYKADGYPAESLIVVKMDTDLHVEWKRFCKTDGIEIYPPFMRSILYEDGHGEEKGVAWAGKCRKTDNTNDNSSAICFFLNHEGPVGLEKLGMEVRPYTFYPNPAKELLHVQYSPDVQPAQVELYDLQGRLVHTQHSGLESIDTGQLPAGTYTMRVTLEDGKTYTDKVVKE